MRATSALTATLPLRCNFIHYRMRFPSSPLERVLLARLRFLPEPLPASGIPMPQVASPPRLRRGHQPYEYDRGRPVVRFCEPGSKFARGVSLYQVSEALKQGCREALDRVMCGARDPMSKWVDESPIVVEIRVSIWICPHRLALMTETVARTDSQSCLSLRRRRSRLRVVPHDLSVRG